MQGYSGHGIAASTHAGKLVSEAISGDSARFEIMANLPTVKFPGGTLLRWPEWLQECSTTHSVIGFKSYGTNTCAKKFTHATKSIAKKRNDSLSYC